MIERKLTPEESAALDLKYGKPLGPIGSIRRNPRYPSYPNHEVQHHLTKERYMELKEEGKTDKQVCIEGHVSSVTLRELKNQWKLSKYGREKLCQEDGCIVDHYSKGFCYKHYIEHRKQEKKCTDCEEGVFAKGLCTYHYYKQWRWNHAN